MLQTLLKNLSKPGFFYDIASIKSDPIHLEIKKSGDKKEPIDTSDLKENITSLNNEIQAIASPHDKPIDFFDNQFKCSASLGVFLYAGCRETGIFNDAFRKSIEKIIQKLIPDLKGADSSSVITEMKKLCETLNFTKYASIRKALQRNFSDIFRSICEQIKKGADPSMTSDPFINTVNEFMDNACFFSYIDSKFNSLQNPDLNCDEVRTVVKFYYASFHAILKGLINLQTTPDDYKDFLCPTVKADTKTEVFSNRVKMSHVIETLQKSISDHFNPSSMYHAVRALNEKKSTDDEIFVATTNYTNFAEEIIFDGNGDMHFSYLHGKLGDFEDIYSKQIAPVNMFTDKNDDTKVLIPFMLAPSGIKPVISSCEVDRFHSAFHHILNDEELIIHGYSLNTDDEHIINVIRERYRKNRPITYLKYNSAGKADKDEALRIAQIIDPVIEETDVKIISATVINIIRDTKHLITFIYHSNDLKEIKNYLFTL